MITAFLVGCVAGFLVAIPPGPVSVTTIARSVHYGVAYALFVGLGAAVSETMYAAMGFFGVKLLYSAGMDTLVRLAGFILVLTLGIRYTFLSPTLKLKPVKNGRTGRNSFLLGLGLSLTTPTIGAAYFIIAGAIRTQSIFEYSIANNVFASVGAGVGSILWVVVLVSGVHKTRNSFGEKTIHMISRASGVLLLLVGGYLGYSLFAAMK